jgi:hypothetical protein
MGADGREFSAGDSELSHLTQVAGVVNALDRSRLCPRDVIVAASCRGERQKEGEHQKQRLSIQ